MRPRGPLTPPKMLELAEEIRQLAAVAKTLESRLALNELALLYTARAAGLDAPEVATGPPL